MKIDKANSCNTKKIASKCTEFEPVLKEIIELRSLLFFTQEKNQQLEELLCLERSANRCFEDYLKKTTSKSKIAEHLVGVAANNKIFS